MEGWVYLGELITPGPGIEPTIWLEVGRPNHCATKTHFNSVDRIDISPSLHSLHESSELCNGYVITPALSTLPLV